MILAPTRPLCEYCGRIPHAGSCPNAPDPPPVFVCSGCGSKIVDGEDYWDIMGEQFCTSCIDKARSVAEYDPY